jgi:hypothetical protein
MARAFAPSLSPNAGKREEDGRNVTVNVAIER